MTPSAIEEHEFTSNGHTTSYLTAGPSDGPLLIFIHGWPAIAETWKPQLLAFSALGFYCVAPDTKGYGKSTVSKKASDYALSLLVKELLALLSHLNRPKAVWIGHDWGSGIVWALVSHHPKVVVAAVSLSIPYRVLEVGLEAEVACVNRSVYPKDEYPYGQFDYQHFYQNNPEKSTQVLERNPAATVKAIFARGHPDSYGKPAPTSTITRDGGWFGGADETPDIFPGPEGLAYTSLDEDLFTKVRDAIAKTGMFGATAYYLNHAANLEFSKSAANGGVLEFPVLYINCVLDIVCSTSPGACPNFAQPMRALCKDLTDVDIVAGHWVGLEKPEETNAAMVKWMVERVGDWWPKSKVDERYQ